jgi:AcrR family transcriptional regulator
MIYHYFGGKEGLYIAVLEETYRRIRDLEATLDLRRSHPRKRYAHWWGSPSITMSPILSLFGW